MTTESINSGLTFAEARAALAAISCKSTQLLLANFPPNAPNGVLLAPTTKIPEIRTNSGYQAKESSAYIGFSYAEIYFYPYLYTKGEK